jgi:hypothetical protein
MKYFGRGKTMLKRWDFLFLHFNRILLWLRIPAQFRKYTKYDKSTVYKTETPELCFPCKTGNVTDYVGYGPAR